MKKVFHKSLPHQAAHYTHWDNAVLWYCAWYMSPDEDHVLRLSRPGLGRVVSAYAVTDTSHIRVYVQVLAHRG